MEAQDRPARLGSQCHAQLLRAFGTRDRRRAVWRRSIVRVMMREIRALRALLARPSLDVKRLKRS